MGHSPWIWNGLYAKSLRDWLNINDKYYIIEGSVDPTVVAQDGPAGSLYVRTNGTLYQKQDAGTTTNWIIFATGGSGATVSNFNVPQLDKITNNGNSLSVAVGRSHLAIVGSNLYLFGGCTTNVNNGVNSIYTATTAAPTVWSTSGNTLTFATNYGALVNVGSNLYLYGGYDGSGNQINKIQTATTAAPTVWSDTGSVFPTNLTDTSVAVVGNNIYFYGGIASGARSNKIWSATTAAPATVTDTGVTLPAQLYDSSIAVIGDHIYLFGGLAGAGGTPTTSIYAASVNDPTTVYTTTGSIPASLSESRICVIGDKVLLTSGHTGTDQTTNTGNVYYAFIDNPLTWYQLSGASLTAALSSGAIYTLGDVVYYVGGINSATSTVSTIQNTSLFSQASTILNGTYGGSSGWFNDGALTALTPFMRYGTRNWETDFAKSY